jgi:membrane-associated phospholipid phosphatase
MPVRKALRQQFLWISGSGAVYVALFLARPLWYGAHCQAVPESCSISGLNLIDRLIPARGSITADFYSNGVQNGAGFLALLLPWLVFRKVRPAAALNLILLAITCANGAFMELIRALIQRPRPIVLAAPSLEASNIHHYTSFYSGHTSFVALSLFFTILWLRRLAPNRHLLHGTLYALYPLLTFATGTLRVIGGRHYPTDTLAGWIFGTAIAAFVGRRLLDQLEEELAPSPSI